MELRDRAESLWPLQPARTQREIEGNLLDSDVQDLLGTEGLGLGRASRWAVASVVYSDRVSDCHEVARGQLLRDLLASCWWRVRNWSSCKGSSLSGFGNAGR